MNIRTENNGNKAFIIYSIEALLLILSLWLPILNVMTLLIAVAYIFKADAADHLCMLLFILPFSPIFKFTLGGFALFNILLMISFVKIVIDRRIGIKKRDFILISIFAFYSIINCFRGNPIECLTLICSLSVGGILFHANNVENCSLIKVLRIVSVSIIITSLLPFFQSIFPNLSLILAQDRIKQGSEFFFRFSGITANSNAYTLLLSIVLAAYCILIIDKKVKPIDFAMFIALSIFGMMSISKSFIISYAIMLVLLLIHLTHNNLKILVLVLLAILCCGWLIYQNLDNQTIQLILYRFQNDTGDNATLNSITTGRVSMWQGYLFFFNDNPLAMFFGVGIGAPILSLGASHNYFLEILYYLGIIGAIPYVLLVIHMFFTSKQGLSFQRIYRYLPWGILLIRGFARNLFLNEMLTFLFIICAMSVSDSTPVMGLPESVKLKSDGGAV